MLSRTASKYKKKPHITAPQLNIGLHEQESGEGGIFRKDILSELRHCDLARAEQVGGKSPNL